MNPIGAMTRLDFTDLDAFSGQLAELPPVESLARFVQQWERAPSKVAIAAETEEERGRTALKQRYGVHVHRRAVRTAHIYRRLHDRGRWDADSLVDFLASGVEGDAETLPLLRTGCERFFARDYISALHVLVPQVEALLRRLVGKLGLPTRSIRDGVTQELPLGEMLQIEQLRQGLGENLSFYLEFLFTRQGMNLCNTIVHGLLSAEQAR